jgi:hypothetical protein
MEEDTGASSSLKVAAVKVAGDGRSSRATAEAIPIAREAMGVRERGGQGWAGSTDPDPSQLV